MSTRPPIDRSTHNATGRCIYDGCDAPAELTPRTNKCRWYCHAHRLAVKRENRRGWFQARHEGDRCPCGQLVRETNARTGKKFSLCKKHRIEKSRRDKLKRLQLRPAKMPLPPSPTTYVVSATYADIPIRWHNGPLARPDHLVPVTWRNLR